MDTWTNRRHNEAASCMTKVTLDVRIVSYFIYAIGFLQLACGVLLITPFSRLGDNEVRRVFFGIVLLSTNLSFAIYLLVMGLVRLLCAWGLIRGRKFAWLLTFICFMYDVIDTVFLFPQDEINAWIGLAVSVVIIAWLWFRRQLYDVIRG